MTGPDRAMLFRTALETGFRGNELRTLRRSDLLLDSTQPRIQLRGKNEKNRHGNAQPVKLAFAAALREYVALKAPDALVFSMPRADETAPVIVADLAEARAAWIKSAGQDYALRKTRAESTFPAEKDETGAVFDFHALRTTFATNLCLAGVALADAAKLMRHSDPRLLTSRLCEAWPGAGR